MHRNDSPIRVCHIIIGLNVGGAELVLKKLVNTQISLENQRHSVISLTESGIIGSQIMAQGIPVVSLGMQNIFDIPKVFYRLVRYLRQTMPDIVQTWMYHADLIGGVAARFAGIKNLIWGVRSTDIRKSGKTGTIWVQKICALLSGTLPRVIICAAEASKQAHGAVGYDTGRMIVIPNGFNLDELYASTIEREALRSTAGFKADDIVIGSLGRFNPVKDHVTFISAAGILVKRYPNLRFLMVGRDVVTSNPALADLIAGTGYSRNFVLLGERQDVRACLSAMDIFCLHSKSEGFPNALGEAMAIGLPCVSTDVGDAAYLLGGDGVLVPAENAEALSTGLEQLVNLSHERRKVIGKRARARVCNDFTMHRTAERFGAVYQSLMIGQRVT